MKTALLISYYWPPSGGAGVQRWLKMSRYFHKFGWKLVVYTPSNPAVPVEDLSLAAQIPPEVEIIRHPIREPYGWYKLATGRKRGSQVYSGFINESGERSVMDKISIWIRGNLFIPDPRVFWVGTSVRRLDPLFVQGRFDVIISTGPPHSTHLIAQRCAGKHGIPWVADFRDPWTGIDYYGELMLTRWADRRQRKLERGVLRSADRVVTVSPSWAKDMTALGCRPVDVISNGYDDRDFQSPAPALDRDFTIAHLGSMNRDRNPLALWQALSALQRGQHPMLARLKIKLIGAVDTEIRKAVVNHGLEQYVEISGFVRHEHAIATMRSSQLLLLPVNRSGNAAGVIPGKFFEYLGSGRPVLLIGPTGGDAATILRNSGGGEAVDFDDAPGVERILLDWFRRYCDQGLQTGQGSIATYSRRALAGQYTDLLDALVALRH